ncbi:hypothetical protein E7681_05375 [Thalassobius vesicularis]|uniref:DUF2497 domain-containing protein n=1 Tax=Thalassobius vesicularis TaxID=1294297 RepID=A0A4S3MC78_9RHOB|nr:hypothetical protein [Thalassobius vesicularis]THD75881.1 hypothetical protein E7681_05375 [Thalassobius vesicularis]
MSNPVTNADIEDVLSSIRRLVSEDARQSVPAPVAEPSGRLVLTPALRVMESARPEEIRSGEASPDTPEDETSADLPQPELVEAYEMAGLSLDDTGRRNLEARIAELEAVITESGGQWEHDGEEGSANAGGFVRRLHWEPEAISAELEDTDEAGFVEMAEEQVAEDTVVAFAEAPAVDEVEVVAIEEPEVETDFAADDYEPAPLDQAEETCATPDFDDDAADEGVDFPADFVVDEQMLRALVAEVVRQELQGALGERITRNVRNLVRREIMRALTSQGLE